MSKCDQHRIPSALFGGCTWCSHVEGHIKGQEDGRMMMLEEICAWLDARIPPGHAGHLNMLDLIKDLRAEFGKDGG
jgi:hypothetical protein